MATDTGGAGRAARDRAAAVLGFLGGLAWCGYVVGLSLTFRGAAPGQAPYSPRTEVYATLLAVPLVLMLVGAPAVRALPPVESAWGRRGLGLAAAGLVVATAGVVAVPAVTTPGHSAGGVGAVPAVGVVLLQVGGSILGYALLTGRAGYRLSGVFLALSLPAAVAGVLATQRLYDSLPFYAGVSVPLGVGWAWACYARLQDLREE